MQGDPKVDELMWPVKTAIERYVKDRAAVTDIYNRAYEAIMNSMEVNESRIAEVETERDEWRQSAKNLNEYVQHYSGCDAIISDSPCDCGAQAIINTLRALEQKYPAPATTESEGE